jgi:hypothetical protein
VKGERGLEEREELWQQQKEQDLRTAWKGAEPTEDTA